jgi:hypothetical protein
MKDVDSTQQRTRYASIRKPNQLQSCREANSVINNKLTEHATRLSGLNAKFWVRSTYSTTSVL